MSNVEWQREQNRVDFVRKEIKKKQNQLRENASSLKQGIIGLRKNFWEDVTVSLDELDDVIETQASIKQQAELLSERERSHGLLHESLKKLSRLEDSPYFGRIDFLEGNESQTEPIYIGIASFLDEKEENFLIYDWRAPISSLYYDYPPGPAQYETMEGSIKGVIELKRQFIIKNGKIKGLFDTGVTIGDRLLQEMLGNQADSKMKSIVATIQKEQNQIIRNEKSRILVVQGVAGSGKTSAALQRVAYLLYTHRETLNSQNMMLFSPNPLFNSYISTVLPELGEENMKQTTYKEFVENLLEKAFTLEDPFEQIEMSLSGKNEKRMNAVQYKSNLEYKKQINTYIHYLKDQGLIFKSIVFRGKTLIHSEKIKDYFYALDRYIPIPNRMKLTAEWLLKELTKLEQLERSEHWVLEEIELLDKEDYLEVYKEIQKNNRGKDDSFNDMDQEEELLRKKIVKKYFQPIRKRVKRYYFLNVKANYMALFNNSMRNVFETLPDGWDSICEITNEALTENYLFWEDVTPFLYFRDKLQGRKAFNHIRHVFIDEFQDYTPFQFDYLKELFVSSKMTLLGDINQAIYPHSQTSYSLLSEGIDSYESKERIVLTRSYRSTLQIVEFTRELAEGGEMINPFNREGMKPALIQVPDVEALHSNLVDCINQAQSEGSQTIAVICKTMAECNQAYNSLKNHLDIQLMDKSTRTYKKGVVIIPAYLAKGIEFDTVMIYNASEKVYNQDSEIKLFYTACTRAMHGLYLFSLGEKSPFLNKVPSDKYNFYNKM